MKSSWGASIAHVLAVEGGYVNRSDDRGGPTKYGITQATLSRHLKRAATVEDVKVLDVGLARLIYEDEYWDSMHCNELPVGADLMVFDAAVHAGQGQATRWLQQAIGVEDDGILGSKTVAAAQAAPALETIRKIAFMRVLESFDDPDDKPNTRGWIDRILKTLVAAVQLIWIIGMRANNPPPYPIV